MLHYVDSAQVFRELVSLRMGCNPQQNPKMLWRCLRTATKRLRALLPADLDMADGASRVALDRLRRYLDMWDKTYGLSAESGEAEGSASLTRDVQLLVEDFTPANLPEAKTPFHISSEAAAEAPPQYLTSWREILIALGFKNNREDKQKVSRLNKSYSGPIKTPGQGKQPFVKKAELLSWWAGLEAKVNETQQRKRDAQATLANQHDFGRDGEVTPDISGGVKKRRQNRKP